MLSLSAKWQLIQKEAFCVCYSPQAQTRCYVWLKTCISIKLMLLQAMMENQSTGSPRQQCVEFSVTRDKLIQPLCCVSVCDWPRTEEHKTEPTMLTWKMSWIIFLDNCAVILNIGREDTETTNKMAEAAQNALCSPSGGSVPSQPRARRIQIQNYYFNARRNRMCWH